MGRPDVSAVEQEAAFMRGVAAGAREYHEALVEDGFTDAEAFTLARDWVAFFVAVTYESSSVGGNPEA